jgi:cytochrome c-type biogenesis protein CcmE
MKKSHIALIIFSVLVIGALVSNLTNTSTYVSFAKAEQHMGKQFTVIGELVKDKPINYNPQQDLLSFYAIDDENNERLVQIHQSKPQDFERSEKITMTGAATDSCFVAKTILLKCPSKYEDQQKLEAIK